MTEPGNDNMAYFAGLLDADGNIYQKRNQGRIYPEINIANGDQKILDWLASRFGGHIQPLRNHYKDSYNRRPRFRWVLNKGQEVKDVLRRCEPYLIA